jgi:hypothetical protein
MHSSPVSSDGPPAVEYGAGCRIRRRLSNTAPAVEYGAGAEYGPAATLGADFMDGACSAWAVHRQIDVRMEN